MADIITTKATVIENNLVCEHTNIIKLKTDQKIDFKIGQFVNIRKGDLKRPYSIASLPSEECLEFCVKRAGVFSNLLCDINEGDDLEVKGPFGKFGVNEDNSLEFIFVGTGTGIAPLKPMIQNLLAKGCKSKITLFFGCKVKPELAYGDLFEKLANEHENFEYIPILSREGDSWHGKRGHVQDVMKDFISDANNKEIYICGLPQMVEGVREFAKSVGFEKEAIKFEKY